MSIEKIIRRITDYFGEYKSNSVFFEVKKFIERRIDPAKYEHLWEAIVEGCNPKFGSPPPSALKDCIDEFHKNNPHVYIYKNTAQKPKTHERPSLEEEQSRLFLFEQIATEKDETYKPSFLVPNDYEEYVNFFYDGDDEYMILISIFFDTYYLVSRSKNGDMKLPSRKDFELARKITKSYNPIECNKAVRYFFSQFDNPSFELYCQFIVDNIQKRTDQPKTGTSKAQMITRFQP